MAYLSLATGEGDVHETAGVRESLLGTALGGLGLLLLLNLFTYWVSRLSGMRLESSSRVSGVVFPRLMELRWNCKCRRVEPWKPWLGEDFAWSSGWVANCIRLVLSRRSFHRIHLGHRFLHTFDRYQILKSSKRSGWIFVVVPWGSET